MDHIEAYDDGWSNFCRTDDRIVEQKGADVNNEETMDGATALDNILEIEEERKLSTEEQTMKTLLLSKGAKTYEERMNDETMNLRREHEEEDY